MNNSHAPPPARGIGGSWRVGGKKGWLLRPTRHAERVQQFEGDAFEYDVRSRGLTVVAGLHSSDDLEQPRCPLSHMVRSHSGRDAGSRIERVLHIRRPRGPAFAH